MICDRCGKSNLKESSRCEYCGSEMPKKMDCGGFEDIFTYNPPVQVAGDNQRGVNE